MKHRTVILFSLAAAFALSGCAQFQAKIAQDVQAASVPDLQAAVADAKAAGDADGAACWQDVLNYVQALPTSSAGAPEPTIAGVASAIEAARIGVAQASIGISIPPIPHQLHKDCAVIVIDATQLAAKLGISAAALSKGVGAASVLKAARAAQP
jgi:hypothetical protein